MKNQKSFSVFAGDHQSSIDNSLMKLKTDRIVQRIWEKDFTVWSKEPTEITNRLGWLNSADVSLELADEICDFVESVKQDGIKNALLLGMGGSSLAPEVFSKTFGSKKDYLNLEVLDSTHPEVVHEYAGKFKPEETLYVVSTKSGGTVETFSFMKFFYNNTLNKVGKEKAGKHFIAITDPGSGLETVAKDLKFRKIFLNDPNIGGRYSALSLFGIVPAALIGADIKKILNDADAMVLKSKNSNCSFKGDNTPAILGVVTGQLAQEGRDKITFITSPQLSHFGNWVEQLIAESTGKIGKGILPVVGENVLNVKDYSSDRFFVNLKLAGENSNDDFVKKLINEGHPVIGIELNDVYELGGEFFRWEMATVIAGWILGIQPFDQPDVEAAKILARKLLAEYSESGTLPQPEPNLELNNIKVYSGYKSKDITSLIKKLAGSDDKSFRAKGNEYIAIQSYMKSSEAADNILGVLRTNLQAKYKAAVTVGYGPRFLHSTGQLHKGDAGKGLFIQLIADSKMNVSIPDNAGDEKSVMSFGTLIKAQAFGDRQALIDKGRNVISFEFDGDNIIQALTEINNQINNSPYTC
jgi:glucose-6-phosphate isomerase